ncbi:bifunctional C40 family peptidase/M15 family metallopeptidase [Campylobacter curvus]|uniref:bifunctional C40 family peptidase/M15 family metallopeptidase n=1 Tax=Campylobacter curvus TaxID=200 RepID=UPI000370242D|nr:SH3 domain-containing protein [Campylobacter curvus]QKF61399.1 putative D-alanyl-D-alanine carboxypeptidase, NlpC/P60 family lipoprotein (SH3b1, SH3b2 type SH3 domains) [Campylobacter curvus]UEB49712.1 SH3 domain-containing protein [Campylobacter curvus]
MKIKILSVFVAAFFVGCASNVQNIDASKQRISLLELNIKQDASSLPSNAMNANFSEEEILKKRFGVFELKGKRLEPNEVFWAFRTYWPNEKKTYYSSNFRPIPQSWFDAQKDNANFAALGGISMFALTAANTALRNFPTDEPIFLNPQTPGEGYPFDYLQESTLSIAHPLFVSHFSKDRAWAFVSDDAVWGWVKVEDIKFINDETAKSYAKQKFISVKVDKTPVYDKYGGFLFYARVGGILPFLSEDNENFYGQVFTRAGLRDYKISKQAASNFPLKFNDGNVKTLINSLLNQPYGWGGVDKLRDCSLFTKDMLASFGVWLPRNSRAQASVGKKIELKGLSDEIKAQIIKEQGVPYLTLIHLPGHIMLYAGFKDADIFVVHDAWGLKTASNGRALIGQTAITTLEIGKDRSDIERSNLLIAKIDSMNIIKPSSGTSQSAKISALKRAYGVDIRENLVIFKDGSTIVFDDFKQKDDECTQGADVQDMNALDYAAFSPLGTALSDAGRCRNYELLGKIYGSSENEVRANLVDIVWLKDSLNLKLKFNSKNGAAQALQAVSDKLDELTKSDPALLEYLKDPGGTFKWRIIAGTNRLSAHSYGIAIDINVAKSHYWQWSSGYQNLIPEKIVRVFEKHKFIWGGRWRHFDTMHFEYRPEMFE